MKVDAEQVLKPTAGPFAFPHPANETPQESCLRERREEEMRREQQRLQEVVSKGKHVAQVRHLLKTHKKDDWIIIMTGKDRGKYGRILIRYENILTVLLPEEHALATCHVNAAKRMSPPLEKDSRLDIFGRKRDLIPAPWIDTEVRVTRGPYNRCVGHVEMVERVEGKFGRRLMALQNGYLYAAATPLSIFGGLGVVKVSFVTLLATTTKLFDGGSWLHDAGFSTTGLVASMITLQRGTKHYGTEAHLERLMKEEHISDPEIIKHIHWSGWKRAGDVGTVGTERLRLYLPWNTYLILTLAVASGLALLPYIYFAIYNQGNNHVWLFPSLRSSGSFLCVVSVQLVLQFRIHYIASSSLRLMKAKGGVKPLSNREKGMLLEEHIEELKHKEQQQQHPKDVEAQHPIDSAPLFPVDPVLGILQFSLVVGMVMIVAGYVGCFNLVSQTRAKGGPYVWLAVEAALSVGRTVVWGLNPRWDKENTGLMFELGLRPRQSSISSISAAGTSISLKWGLQVDSDAGSAMTSTAAAQTFPPITSPCYHLLDEETPIQYAGQDAQWKHSFVAHNLEDFLVAASPYIGPLERIEVDGFSIYYAVVAKASQNHIQKLLCVTIVSHGAAWDAHSFLVDGEANDSCRCAFLSHTRPLPGTHALEVAFYGKLDNIGPNTGLDNEVLSPIIEYSNKLSCLLVAKGSSSRPLPVLWSLTFPLTSSNAAEVKKVELRSEIEAGPLSEISLLDKIYM
ncbi:hypothetical protein PM082_011572 [Marasmius tenuissimus]|nr:hypothetical protein PM082_011572 [Marasmius tenuissimus]